MLLLKADPLTEAGAPPNERLLSEMGGLMQEITAAGAMLAGDGLKPSSEGARVFYSGDQRRVLDGPFTESKELIAGYSIVQTESKQQAIDWARRMLEMTKAINKQFFPEHKPKPGESVLGRVTCYTCHQGDSKPKIGPGA